MWSLYIFVNKLLKLQEARENESDEDKPSYSGSCSLRFSSTNRVSQDVLLSRSHFIEVPQVNQLYNWDCGLACVLMVLQTIGINNCNLQVLENLCGTQSIWTVDLAYLLRSFSVIFSYFTVTLGANPNFSVETFYKEQLPHDLDRVDLLFQKALEAGIRIEEQDIYQTTIGGSRWKNPASKFDQTLFVDKSRSFSREELSLLILSGKYIAIALVDQFKLRQSWLEDVCTTDFYESNRGYTGHYVVICGYDADRDEFEIRDPAISRLGNSCRKCQRVSSNLLDEARKSFGTDEDLLLISLEQRCNERDASDTTNKTC